jgi:hypothetical protein
LGSRNLLLSRMPPLIYTLLERGEFKARMAILRSKNAFLRLKLCSKFANFPIFCHKMARKVNIFFRMRPKDQFGLAVSAPNYQKKISLEFLQWKYSKFSTAQILVSWKNKLSRF